VLPWLGADRQGHGRREPVGALTVCLMTVGTWPADRAGS
jgi:hypothetical protein